LVIQTCHYIFAPKFYNSMTILTSLMSETERKSRKFKLTSLLTFTFSLAVFFAGAQVDKAQWSEGKALFRSNCAACHNPKVDGTGPALQGVTSRWEGAGDHGGKTGKQWLYSWIKNYNDPVKAGYPYAVAMQNSRPSAMNVFASLKDADIDKILLYTENPDAGAPAANVKAPDAATTAADQASSGGTGTTLYLFVFFLILLVIILVVITNKLDAIVAEKRGEPVVAKIPFYKRRNFIVALILIAIVYSGYKTVDTFTHWGRQQGYQPTQPIKYSHALHAGKHKIDCQYCHSTAYKGKHANIPSVSTCMNCHKNITKGPLYGTEEISKIYAAVGWDVMTKTYSKPPKPVEWVRIHNLPDHVYFNHSQHVNAGKVECQTCHGPIETMEEVYQYSPLSMGWCINCHRNTEVQFASNNYYSSYESIHKKLKDKTLSKVTVENIGGTECQRCHY
jgi:mono/diheme cytochrome c family protein